MDRKFNKLTLFEHLVNKSLVISGKIVITNTNVDTFNLVSHCFIKVTMFKKIYTQHYYLVDNSH